MACLSTSLTASRTVSQVVSDAESDRTLALLARVRDGDVAAFEMIYDRYHRLIFGIALRVCQDAYLAEDIQQTVFLKLWRSPEAYRQGCFAAWLCRVARNQSIDAVRKRALITDVSVSRSRSGETGGNDVCDRLEATWVRSALIRALAKLRSEERTLIELGFIKGLTHVQIAREARIPIGTVKTRIRTGLLRLRALVPPGIAPFA